MKNKIFLTSMLAVMVACPAYSSVIEGVMQPNSSQEDCSGAAIGGVTANNSTVQYTAQWTPDECTITLNPNGGANGTGTLFTKFGVGAYLTSADRTANTNLMTSSANPIVAPTYDITISFDVSGAPSGSNVSAPSNISGSRSFSGYYDASTGGTQYISGTSPYYILGDISTSGTGAAAAANVAKEDNNGSCPSVTWYAQWSNCATLAASLPTTNVTGYTFGGWYDAATGGNLVDDNTCFSANQTLYGLWTPKHYNVAYVCGDGATGSHNDNYDSSTGLGGATYGEGYTFDGNICQKEGSTQGSWNCVENTSGTTVNQSANTTAWQVDDSVTCTAVYDVNTITLEWYKAADEGGGEYTDLNNSASCIYGTPDGITVHDPVRRGYSFAGWEIVGTEPEN